MKIDKGLEKIRITSLVFWWVLLTIIFLIFINILNVSIGNKIGIPLINTLIGLIFYAIPIIWIGIKFKRDKLGLKKIIGSINIRFGVIQYIFLILIIYVYSIGIQGVTLYILSFTTPSYVLSQLNKHFLYSKSDTNLFVLCNLFKIITAVAIAPIVEELVFRGIFLNRLSSKWNLTVAIFVSSVIFGILHLNPVVASTFSILMSLIYIKTKSIKVTIICHTFNNSIVLLLSILNDYGKGYDRLLTLKQYQMEVWIYILCIIVSTPFIIRYIYKNWPSKTSVAPYFN